MQAKADRNELETFSLDLLQGAGLEAGDSHLSQSREFSQPVPHDNQALSWSRRKPEPSSSSGNSSTPLDFLSSQQVISSTCVRTDGEQASCMGSSHPSWELDCEGIAA